MGAQKVTTDFNKLEQEAILAGQIKESQVSNASKLSPEEQEETLNSIKLAYQEKKKITESRLKSSDPNKASQLERLGMGMGSRVSAISHSAVTDMKVIEQSTPVTSSRVKDFSNDSFMNDLGFSSSSSSNYKYKDLMKQNDDDFWSDNGAFAKKHNKKPDIIDSITTIDLDRKYACIFFTMVFYQSLLSFFPFNSHGKSRSKPEASLTNSSNNASATFSQEAQKKFASAKAISSDQFFEHDKSSVWILILCFIFHFDVYLIIFSTTIEQVLVALKVPGVLAPTITLAEAQATRVARLLMVPISIRPTCTTSRRVSKTALAKSPVDFPIWPLMSSTNLT